MDFFRRTWAEIDVNALKHNFGIIEKEIGNADIMAVVKANAYGHDYKIVVPVLDECGADSFAVSNIGEAMQIRELGITKPILILGYTPENMADILAVNDITQCVYSLDFAKKLSDFAVRKNVFVKIHIKFDTGMGRIGFDLRTDELNGIKDAVSAAKLPHLIFDGVFTHFAESDRNEQQEDGFTDLQYSRFVKGIEVFKSMGLKPDKCHCCNSAALCLDKEKHLDMCRAGIILYGLTPSVDLKLNKDFKPVMTFKTIVSMVKNVDKGQTINYGRTYKTDKVTKIATLAVGYADGYSRQLSNSGYVLIKGEKANIVGRICMDQMSVDVSDIPDVAVGDEVILFGKDLKVEEISGICNTINYETVCDVSSRVQRIAVYE